MKLLNIKNTYDIHIQGVPSLDLDPLLSIDSVAVLPGTIPYIKPKLLFKEGDKVKANQKLCILEAMKMENEIDSLISGTVRQIYYKAGDKLDKGNIIMDIIS